MSPDTGHVYKGSDEQLKKIEKSEGPLMPLTGAQAQDLLSKTPRDRIRWAQKEQRKAKNKRKEQKKARRKNRR